MRSDRPRRTLLSRLLLALGVAAQLLAVLSLMRVDPLLEYAAPAPEVREILNPDGTATVDAGLEARREGRERVAEELADALAALSMSGRKSGFALASGQASVTASLCAVDVGWLETCPRRFASGRWMDGSELEQGAGVAVLDEDLAFALFGSATAEGGEVEIGGESYRVIGTLRHRRSVGEVDAYTAYIPLNAAARQGIQLDTITLHALGASASGLGQSFGDAARGAWGGGELHDLHKERMGALLLTRLLLCSFGLLLTFRLGRGLMRLLRRWREEVDERRRHAYLLHWLWPALWRALTGLLCAAALLCASYGILRVAIEPVYSFTEWVPESLVSLRALRNVFLDRTSHAARLIRVATPPSAAIAFWGSIDRAGVVVLLFALALPRRPKPPRAGEE